MISIGLSPAINHIMDRQNIRWIILFCMLMGLFYWLHQSRWFQEAVLGELPYLTAKATAWILSFLGLHVKQTSTVIITASGHFEIAESCTGSFVFMMLAAAILPFPSPWKSRLEGLLLGLVTLVLINLFRTSFIVLVASRFPTSLLTLHVIVGQIIVIVGMMAVFLWWARSNQQNVLFFYFKSKKSVIRTLFLFGIGYLCGYWLYQIFLDSSFGLLVKQLIERHLLWIISLFKDTFIRNQAATSLFQPVRLVEGCLSSPMIVLIVAVVFAWPARWWKRVLILLLGFVPFFYVYHLVRALLISISLSTQPNEINLAYNFFGQVFLTITLFAWVAYLWCSKENSISYGRFFGLFLKSGLIALVVALGLGWFGRHILIPFLASRITGSTALSYDPQQTISSMADLQTFIWISLVGTTPGLSHAKKWFSSSLGALAALAVLATVVAFIATFQLAPHVGLFKFVVILPPFAVYYLWCFRPKRGAQRESAGRG